jgi:kumamolisin
LKPFERARPSRAGAVLAAGTAGTLLLFMAAGPASSATYPVTHPRPGSKVAVPQGIGAAALAGDPVFGKTPPGTPEIVSFILTARHVSALKADVTGGLPSRRISVRRFASDFGQAPAHILALEDYLAHFKIRTKSHRDGLDVSAHGTAGEFDKALTVQQDNFRIPAVRAHLGQPARPAMVIHGTTDKPLLPRSLARFVLAILGLTNYPVASSSAVHEPATASGAKPAAVQTGSRTPADFASQYNLDPLYKAGFTGAGQTIGIVTLASIRPSDATFFWKHVLHIATRSHKIRLINVDGGAGKVSNASGSGETTLDVEQSGALAPGAKVVVYQAPNTDPGFLDAFYDAASQNEAGTVSTSWGEAETVIDTAVASGAESPAYEIAFDQAFLEMGAQGQSTFVTAGDAGAYDDSDELGTTNLAVDNPGDSPWATTAGGTTLAGTVPLSKTDSAHIPAQRAWGWDWLWPHFKSFGFTSEAKFAFSAAAGGGGGFSADIPMPGYQRLIPGIHDFSDAEYLTPIHPKPLGSVSLPTKWAFNPSPPVGTGTGFGRAVPDVSADADPFTGYEEYFTGFPGKPLEDGWGGTSFVAPQLNGATAVIDQAVGHRVGFWNPSVYRWAAGPDSPFRPLDTASAGNTNLFYTGTPGHVFNPASGLGTPDLARLARDFAAS